MKYDMQLPNMYGLEEGWTLQTLTHWQATLEKYLFQPVN